MKASKTMLIRKALGGLLGVALVMVAGAAQAQGWGSSGVYGSAGGYGSSYGGGGGGYYPTGYRGSYGSSGSYGRGSSYSPTYSNSYSYSRPSYTYSTPSYSYSRPTYTYSRPSYTYTRPATRTVTRTVYRSAPVRTITRTHTTTRHVNTYTHTSRPGTVRTVSAPAPRTYYVTRSNHYRDGSSRQFGFLNWRSSEDSNTGYSGPGGAINKPHRADWENKIRAQRKWDEQQYAQANRASANGAECGFTTSPAYCYELEGPYPSSLKIVRY